MKKKLYSLYKKTQRFSWLNSLFSMLYFLSQRLYYFVKSPPLAKGTSPGKPKVIVVCDQMTFENFSSVFDFYFVTPYNWKKTLHHITPDFFFCESAWSGIEAYPDSWRGRVYKDQGLWFEPRKPLFRLLQACQQQNIPTVFWNKEDPTFFGHPQYNFSDTALSFDIILTTAKECIPQYERMGHSQVDLLPFGYAERLFYPTKQPKTHQAVFAGSWYEDQPKRCQELEEMFDFVLRKEIPLIIYNRHWNSANPVHVFPEKYQKYCRPAVAYHELGEIYRVSRYGININTVTTSETMFARRVLEMMACQTIVISNQSKGLKELFSRGIWFYQEPWDVKKEPFVIKENLNIIKSFSVSAQGEYILSLLQKPKNKGEFSHES